MLMKPDRPNASELTRPSALYLGGFALVSVIVSLVAYGRPLLELVRRWTVQEEYSHGFLIPLIVAWLLLSRRKAIVDSIGQPSWVGPLLILIAAAMHVVGVLSALYLLSQVGFVVTLLGVALGLGGWPLLR